MEQEQNTIPSKEQKRKERLDPQTGFFLYFVTTLVTIPLFIIVYPFVPSIELPIGDGYRIDHFVAVVLIILLVRLVVRKFLKAFYMLCSLGVVLLTINSVTGGYGFREVAEDYRLMLHGLNQKPVMVPMLNGKMEPFANAQRIEAAIDLDARVVRNYALDVATKHFQDFAVKNSNRVLVHSFSIFKEINSSWTYVADPVKHEYFATASETIGQLASGTTFKGDCDDHTILMAACIKNVGGYVRLVRTQGHIYPELRIGDEKDLEYAIYLIRRYFFEEDSKGKNIYYHIDPQGVVWLNMDYTATYPGGEFMHEEILGVLEL